MVLFIFSPNLKEIGPHVLILPACTKSCIKSCIKMLKFPRKSWKLPETQKFFDVAQLEVHMHLYIKFEPNRSTGSYTSGLHKVTVHRLQTTDYRIDDSNSPFKFFKFVKGLKNRTCFAVCNGIKIMTKTV